MLSHQDERQGNSRIYCKSLEAAWIHTEWEKSYKYILLTRHEVKMAGYWQRRSWGPKKCKKRMGPIPSHLDRTGLVNKRFIVSHKEHWNKYSAYLFIFKHWKGNQLYPKVMVHDPKSYLGKLMQKIQSFDWLHFWRVNVKLKTSLKTRHFNRLVLHAVQFLHSFETFAQQ